MSLGLRSSIVSVCDPIECVFSDTLILQVARILHPDAFPIIETDASNIGYGGILKQDFQNKISIIRFHSGIWSGPQENYSTIKKEILAIVLCIQKFQEDVFNKKFLICVDCKNTKEILQKDVKNIVSKQIFARWQAIL